MIKAVFDTNLYVGWMRDGSHEDLMLDREFARYLSAVVQLELRAGTTTTRATRAVDQLVAAYARGGRRLVPAAEVFDQAGTILKRLRSNGREVRRASLVNDVLIAVSARVVGATVFTADAADFEAIHEVWPFELRVVTH